MIDFDALVLAPCMETFGEPVSGVSQTFGAFTLPAAVFVAAYTQVKFENETPVSTTDPMLGARVSDFPSGLAPMQGDTFTIRGITYRAVDVNEDSLGHVKIQLIRAP